MPSARRSSWLDALNNMSPGSPAPRSPAPKEGPGRKRGNPVKGGAQKLLASKNPFLAADQRLRAQKRQPKENRCSPNVKRMQPQAPAASTPTVTSKLQSLESDRLAAEAAIKAEFATRRREAEAAEATSEQVASLTSRPKTIQEFKIALLRLRVRP